MDKRGKFIAYLSRVLAFSKREETMDERRTGPIIKILCLFSTAALPMVILILLAAALGILPARVARADVYDVININANGVGSLRQAILDANERGGHDTITFSITGTIVLTDTLPQITDDLTISGPGPDSLAISGDNAYRVLEIASSTAVTITGVTVENGIAAGEGDDADGGGIYSEGTVDISNATIYSNTATTSGGGIYNAGGTVDVSNSTFSGNTADEGGGGIYTFGGPLNITNSTFSGNTAREGGGGICCDSDVLNISNSTFSDNMAVLEEGGGIFNKNGTVNITNTTIYSNTALLKGGGIFNESGTTYIANTILAGNSAETSGGNCYNGAEGTITSQGYNVESANDCGLSATGDITNSTTITTTLGTLANNGGPTWTHALLQEDSPAVDQIPHGDNGCGTTYTTDQRGYNRPHPLGEKCDIGAFEYQAMPPTPTPTPTGTPTATPTSTPTATDTPTPTPTPTTDPCDAANLINAINTANGEGADTIDLIGVCTYTLTVVDNDTDGPNGLPSITGTITINGHGATIERNSADDFRIFHVASGGSLTLTDITVTNGNADDYGGGIYNEGALNVSNSTLSGNGATYSGGGIYNKGTVAVTNNTLSGNTANYGSGIYNEGTVDISYSTLSGNTASVEGGGILNIFNDSTVSISYSTLSDNTAGVKGGGILNNGGRLNISSSSVYSNTATAEGGGGICNTGTVTITHSTLSSNTAFYGGGVYNESTLSISHSTLSDNGADKYGGGIFNLGDTALVKNTIVANNTASSGPDCHGTLSSYGYNLVEDTSDCSISGDPAGNILGSDPNLGPLQDNGGPTWTHALLPGSPAMDHIPDKTNGCGITCTTDQRGVSRPQDGNGDGTAACDIGAYEYELPPSTSVGCDVTELISAINTANGSGSAHVINLAADCTYTLTDGPFSANGDNGLPSITSTITFNGNGATIERSSGGDTPDFRIFHVAGGASLILSNLTIANGDAGSEHGGGIYSAGTLNISNSTLFGNTGSYGGGIMNSSGTVDISNSTLSDNTATSGGGIYVYNESTLNISYSTVFSNTATSGGGIYNGGTVNIKNTIVADNTPDNCDGTMTSQGYNLESGTDCGFALSNANADLGPLQNNGGPTWTHALGDISEAFDQIPYGQSGCGTNYTTGQRGYIRPYPPEGSCDIGAYEQCTLYGDVNCDCVVNIEDVMLVANRWRCQSEDPCYSEVYDFDQDGDIDVVDIMLVTAHWGDTCS